MDNTDTDNIIIVGGGAGGLELACKLGRKLGRQRVTLVDQTFYHIWKPSLHEVAAGTMDMHQEGLPYTMLAHQNHFTFVYGAFAGLDLIHKTITVSAVAENTGEVMIPERTLAFSRLCIAVGSTSNYFGTPGAEANTISLNGPGDAEHFRMEMLKKMTWAEHRKAVDPAAGVNVVIIGGGATGVELAAELREASKRYIDYGFRQLDPVADIRITLIEGGPRILTQLPVPLAATATNLLEERSITVVTDCRVAEIGPGSVRDVSGRQFSHDICVWAAGIRAPSFLATLGLPTNRSGQLVVTDHLNVQGHPHVYAFGDCAECVMQDGSRVPPRAQAAHQQADYLYKTFIQESHGAAPVRSPYLYRDYGSLVSVGTENSVGTLMGSLRGRSWYVRGALARVLYVSLHTMHDLSVLGWLRTASLALGRTLIRRNTARVKLH